MLRDTNLQNFISATAVQSAQFFINLQMYRNLSVHPLECNRISKTLRESRSLPLVSHSTPYLVQTRSTSGALNT